MRSKVVVFVLLVFAFSFLITLKGVRTDEDTLKTPKTSTTTQTSTDNLVDEAIQNKKPAWLLFHSTT